MGHRTRSRTLLALGMLAILAALAGCGESGVGQSASSEGPQREKPLIGFMPKLTGFGYFEAANKGAQEAAKELGVEVDYDGPAEADPAAQAELIEQWVQQRYDAIAVSANDPDALAPAMERAQQAGIETSTWDADVQQRAREVFLNQATFEAIGRGMVDLAAEQTDGRGDFLVVTAVLTAPNQNRWIEEMREYIREKYPDMRLAAVEPGDEDLAKSQEVTTNYLRAHPDTAGVIGVTAVGTPAAAEAVERLGLEDEVVVTGLGLPNQMRPYVKSGTVEKFLLWNPLDIGYAAIHIAKAQIDGTMPRGGTFRAGRLGELEMLSEDEVLLGDPLVFDRQNIDDFDF
jgi:rhamnose ABC transporter rhamnose-binding protein